MLCYACHYKKKRILQLHNKFYFVVTSIELQKDIEREAKGIYEKTKKKQKMVNETFTNYTNKFVFGFCHIQSKIAYKCDIVLL